MSTDWSTDDLQLTTEQLIQEAGRGLAEAERSAIVAEQMGATPADRLESLSDDALLQGVDRGQREDRRRGPRTQSFRGRPPVRCGRKSIRGQPAQRTTTD